MNRDITCSTDGPSLKTKLLKDLKPNGQRDYQTLDQEVLSALNTICAGGKIKIILT
jgi:hypothetical protein